MRLLHIIWPFILCVTLGFTVAILFNVQDLYAVVIGGLAGGIGVD